MIKYMVDTFIMLWLSIDKRLLTTSYYLEPSGMQLTRTLVIGMVWILYHNHVLFHSFLCSYSGHLSPSHLRRKSQDTGGKEKKETFLGNERGLSSSTLIIETCVVPNGGRERVYSCRYRQNLVVVLVKSLLYTDDTSCNLVVTPS